MKKPASHRLFSMFAPVIRHSSSVIRHRRLIQACSGLLAIVCFSSPAFAALQPISGQVPPGVSQLTPLSTLPGTNELLLAISLPLRNHAALESFLRDLYDPSSPSFHHYLTAQQFADQFGPTEADYDTLKQFAQTHNLQITTTHPNRTILSVKGSVDAMSQAFHVTFNVYHHPTEERDFYAPSSDPSLDISIPVLHVSGLDNFSTPKPALKRSGNKLPSATPNAGSGPGGSYLGLDFRNAYVPGTTLDGSGQSVALVEFDGYFPADITSYLAQANLNAVPLVNVTVDGFNGQAGFNNLEVALDIDMAIAMAPGLSRVYIYEAPNPSPWEDILNRIATDNLSRQISASWGGGSFNPNPAAEQIFQQFAAQGQSYFNSSGDDDAYTTFIPFPSDSPNVISVGGTTLTTTGPLGDFVSETVWNWGGGVGSSGGISPNFSIPSWQTGIDMTQNHGSTTFRNIPDVALTADNIFIYAFNGVPLFDVGGTSVAAPLWAGFTALVNQQAIRSGRAPVGFLNPALYAIGKSSAGSTLFHDVVLGDNTSPASTNDYFGVTGYDLATGWGSPAGTNLINILAPPFPTPVFVVVTNLISNGNGNGMIDPGECSDMSIVLQNIGSVGGTNILATLTTTNADVIIAQRLSPYGNIITNAFGTNLIPFRISTTPNFVCGTPIEFDMQIKCDEGIFSTSLVLPTGTISSSNRFDSTGLVPIPDANPVGVDSFVAVTNFAGNIGKVTVSLYLTHTFDSDLQLMLIAPDGTTNILAQNEGGGGQNFGFDCSSDFSRTVFDDSASTPIGSGQAPFVGSFRPEQPLSVYNGKSGTNVVGIWRLHAVDQAAVDTGVLQCWSLNLFPIKCSAGGGQCPGVDLSIGMVSSPEPATLGSNFVYIITVTNAGPDVAHNSVISQILPSTVTFISASSSQGGISAANGVVTANLGDVPATGTATAMVTVRANQTGAITSSASVSSSNLDFDPSNNNVALLSHVNPPFSDLSISVLALPNPVQVGQSLTYTLFVTNNGPTTAANVTVTNLLPSSETVLNVSGSNTVSGGTVVLFLGNLTNGAFATSTIQVRPNLVGTVVETSTVYTTGTDPLPGNNTASASAIVGFSSDLAIGLVANPTSVVLGSNITYSISVTNFGPSDASGVIINDSLPDGLIVISTNVTKGSLVVTGSVVSASVGALTNGEIVRMTIGVTTTNLTNSVATLIDAASVTGVEADPNPTNNIASATVSVAPPFVSFAIGHAQLESESFTPADGAVEPGETVTVRFFLQNIGNIPNTGAGLLVTLLPTNGVTSPSGQQNYGNIAPGGVQSRSFSFTAAGTNGGSIIGNLMIQDPSTNQILTYAFVLPKVQTFASTNRIDIPATTQNQLLPGPGSPYPSILAVSNVVGSLGRVTVTLSNLNHTYPHDINLLLVGPTGVKTLLFAGAADQSSVSGVDLTFDDFAAAPIPDSGQIASASYQPSAYSAGQFTNPAPAGPYGNTALSTYLNLNPNGLWALYAYDDAEGDYGYIGGGWSLSFTTISPVNQLADLSVAVSSPSSPFVGDAVTNTFTINNAGPSSVSVVWVTNTLSANVTLSSAANSANAPFTINGRTLVANLGLLGSGASRTVTLVTIPNVPGPITNSLTAIAASGEIDLSPLNASGDAIFNAVLPTADLAVTNFASLNPLTIGSNDLVTVLVTNAGPNNALNVVVSNPIPAGLSLVSSNSSQGSVGLVSGSLIASLGTIPAGSNAVVSFVVNANAQGFATNVSTVIPFSLDPVASNNVSATIINVTRPLPTISAAGAVLVAESFSPANSTIDPGEKVTVALYLANAGPADAPNLAATLLVGGGVSEPSVSQNYGTLIHAAPSVSREFTFTADSSTASAGVIAATLQLTDGTGYTTNITYYFSLPFVVAGANPSAITIPDHGPASPYPSVITVSGVTGAVQTVTVSLNGLTHSFPHDVDALLVSPSGQKVMLFAGCGGGHPVSGVNLTFDDAAAGSLSEAAQMASGTYKPSDSAPLPTLSSPVPAGPVSTNLSAFSGLNPNGNWSLYLFDSAAGDAGVLSGGWTISITTVQTINPTVNLVLSLSAPAGPLPVGASLTYTYTLTNQGPAVATNVVLNSQLPPGLNIVSSNATSGTLTIGAGALTIANLSLAPSSGLVATLVAVPSVSGFLTNKTTASCAQVDLDLLSNTAQVTTLVASPAAAALNIIPAAGGQFEITLTGEANKGFVIQTSSDLVNWVPVYTGTTAPNGTLHFTTTNGPSFSHSFFRSVRLP